MIRIPTSPLLLAALALATALGCGGEIGGDEAPADASWIGDPDDAGLDDADTDDVAQSADAGTLDIVETSEASPPPLTACGAPGPASLTDLSAEELSARLEEKDFLLINVASASDGQIPQTDSYVPYNDAEALVVFIGPDLDTPVVLYCNSGGRSRVAGNSLIALGYCQISHLAGGKNAWVEAGYDLE